MDIDMPMYLGKRVALGSDSIPILSMGDILSIEQPIVEFCPGQYVEIVSMPGCMTDKQYEEFKKRPAPIPAVRSCSSDSGMGNMMMGMAIGMSML